MTPETTCARCGVVILPAAPAVSWGQRAIVMHPGCWDAEQRATTNGASR